MLLFLLVILPIFAFGSRLIKFLNTFFSEILTYFQLLINTTSSRQHKFNMPFNYFAQATASTSVLSRKMNTLHIYPIYFSHPHRLSTNLEHCLSSFLSLSVDMVSNFTISCLALLSMYLDYLVPALSNFRPCFTLFQSDLS